MSETVNHNLSIWTLILDAGIVVQLVLILLLILSFVSWAIIFNKWRTFKGAKQEDTKFADLFWGGSDMQKVLAASKTMKASPQAMVFQQAFREYLKARQAAQQQQEGEVTAATGMLSVRHAMDTAWSKQMDQYGHHLSFLATVGATAPFIGLFGTVWGIIDAFQNIGISQNTSLATVAPGIAEALVATAFGLLAAIPAVIAYNTFSAKMKVLNGRLDDFTHEFMNILARHVRK
ncbi:protein TolQ [Ghiorsea bivora]|uniref:protein TolQ n=1 Tax=Ghiorsea bivora TaxID=1485545 RepID=UPI000A645C67|nr:protein TolQ [Ghiorsea bivora]